MAYFSVSADVGATVEVLGQETTPAGTVFYQVNVYYAGNAYPLFVSADGSYCVEPENFYSTYGGGGYAQTATEAYGGYDAGANGGYDAGAYSGYDAGANGGYDAGAYSGYDAGAYSGYDAGVNGGYAY